MELWILLQETTFCNKKFGILQGILPGPLNPRPFGLIYARLDKVIGELGGPVNCLVDCLWWVASLPLSFFGEC